MPHYFFACMNSNISLSKNHSAPFQVFTPLFMAIFGAERSIYYYTMPVEKNVISAKFNFVMNS